MQTLRVFSASVEDLRITWFIFWGSWFDDLLCSPCMYLCKHLSVHFLLFEFTYRFERAAIPKTRIILMNLHYIVETVRHHGSSIRLQVALKDIYFNAIYFSIIVTSIRQTDIANRTDEHKIIIILKGQCGFIRLYVCMIWQAYGKWIIKLSLYIWYYSGCKGTLKVTLAI